ncbi:MAG: Ig-like domain-containing protein, partial [Desulfobacterales bacterium]|nr:Ig-like domain-containing protein [Desulfobacterales bacterium]
NVNDAPTVSNLPSTVTVTEDVASNVDLSALTLSDSDSTGANFTLTISSAGGTLAASASGGVTISGSGTTTITLTGTASDIDNYLNTASNIQYTGTTNTFGTAADTLTLTANDQDGSGNVTLGTVDVNISAVNDAPVNSGSLPSDITFTEDVAGNVDLSAMNLSDVDTTGNVVLTLAAGSGTLNASNGSGVTIGGDGTGTLTLTGTIADINTFLDTASNIQYTGAADINGNNVTTLAVSINDQDGSGNVSLGTVNIDITAVNDAPSLAGLPTSATVTEDSASNLDLSALTLSDIDSPGTNFTLTIAAGSGNLAAASSGGVTISGSGTGTLILTGAASSIDTYLNTTSNIQYTGSANNFGTNADTLTITANDQAGANNTTTGTVNVNITNVNDAPTVSNLPSTVTVTEDAASDVDLSALTLSDSDSTGANFTLTITAGAGTLAASSSGGVTISGSGTTTLTLTGTASDID